MTIKVFSPLYKTYPASRGVLASFNRLGIQITDNQMDEDITHVMPLSDRVVRDCVDVANRYDLPYLSPESAAIIADKFLHAEKMAQFGMPSLKTIVPMAPSDLDELPQDRPCLVKKRRSVNKEKLFSYAYQIFENPAALKAVLGDDFWLYQANPDETTGEYVAQEVADTDGEFVHMKVFHFAVNGNSELLFSRNTDVRFRVDDPYKVYDALGHSTYGEYGPLIDIAGAIAKDLQIKNAFMSIQMLSAHDSLCLIDWNFRPGQYMFMVTANINPTLFDRLMAFTFDIDPDTTPIDFDGVMYYKQFESWPHNPAIRELMTQYQLEFMENDQHPLSMGNTIYLYTTAPTAEDALQRFAGFEEEFPNVPEYQPTTVFSPTPSS